MSSVISPPIYHHASDEFNISSDDAIDSSHEFGKFIDLKKVYQQTILISLTFPAPSEFANGNRFDGDGER